MSVKNQHEDYKKMLPQWTLCETVCDGQRAVHAAGKNLLPALKDQNDEDYKTYRDRTPFYNATWRTVVGLQGMIFRKPPKVEVPNEVQPMLENVTLTGTPLHLFVLSVVEEALKIGRLGIFVDFPPAPDGATKADAVRLNFRPSMRMYKAKSIINWDWANINNEACLSLVVMEECVTVAGEDEFTKVDKIQYRVLDLIDVIGDDEIPKKMCRIRVFEIVESGGKSTEIVTSVDFPKANGVHLERIPFQFIGIDSVNWEVAEPPLIDLVDMNVSHYRVTADYEHGCHFTALPTAVISGFKPDPNNKGEKFYIGSTTAWTFSDANTRADFLEFTGQGLKSLVDNLTKKESHMAILGARMLESQVPGIEAADTAAIHRGGEQSTLASAAQAVSIGFAKILKVFCEFAGATTTDENVVFELNRDFFPVPMDALTITALIAAWQNGAYSYETMFENLKKGEIVPPERTVEEEQTKIKKYPYVPPMAPVAVTPGNDAKTKPGKKSPKAAATPATPAPTQTQLQNGNK